MGRLPGLPMDLSLPAGLDKRWFRRSQPAASFRTAYTSLPRTVAGKIALYPNSWRLVVLAADDSGS